jgi:hypothetical protein
MSFVPLRQRDLVANQAKLTWTTTKAYLQLDCGPIGPPASEQICSPKVKLDSGELDSSVGTT